MGVLQFLGNLTAL